MIIAQWENLYIVIIVNAKVIRWHVFDKMAIAQLSTLIAICLSNSVFRLYYGTYNSINWSHWVHV